MRERLSRDGSYEGGHFNRISRILEIYYESLPREAVSRAIIHEYGHALGLNHLENKTEHWMSYYGTGSGKYNLGYKLTDSQIYNLKELYKDTWFKKIKRQFTKIFRDK